MGERVRRAQHIFSWHLGVGARPRVPTYSRQTRTSAVHNGLCLAFLAVLIMFSSGVGQSFTATEILFIEWGDGPDQLRICEPFIEHNPEDSSEFTITDCGGPDMAFVDKNENFYFTLYYFRGFKAFHSDGSLLFDYSEGTPGYKPEFYRNGVGEFYVDSLCRIYINGSFDYDYVAVVDTMGNLLAKLSPYGAGSGNRMVSLDRDSDDALLFRVRHDGQTMLYTYRNQQFIPGGCEWLAADGNCYWVRKIGTSTIEFKKYGDRDSLGEVGWEQIVTQQYPLEIFNLGLSGVDDNMKIYLWIAFPETDEARVAVYDTLFQLDTEFVLPSSPNRYDWAMSPFMRHDGNVYEFRCTDDGMHIYRWVRE